MKSINTVGYAIGNINTFSVTKAAKKVTTKSWFKANKNNLSKWSYKLTSANIDLKAICKGILTEAFGVNIGEQVLDKLSDEDMKALRKNIIFA